MTLGKTKKGRGWGAFLTQKTDNHSNVNTRLTPNDLSYPENFNKTGLGVKQPCYLIMTICSVQVAKIESRTHGLNY